MLAVYFILVKLYHERTQHQNPSVKTGRDGPFLSLPLLRSTMWTWNKKDREMTSLTWIHGIWMAVVDKQKCKNDNTKTTTANLTETEHH